MLLFDYAEPGASVPGGSVAPPSLTLLIVGIGIVIVVATLIVVLAMSRRKI